MIKRVQVLTLLGFLLVAGVSAPQDSSAFKVVVNSSSSVSALTKARVSRLFLKKVTRWDNNSKVLPVDQLEKSAVRQAFSREIHNKDVTAIKSYWNTALFAGRATPPPELASDEEILSYVRSNAGAIGYVARSTSVGEDVKVVEVTG